MSERKTFLRALYTINSCPQYILARSLSPVSVTLVPQEDSHMQLKLSDAPVNYASVSLRICLETICRSSPELTQDSGRDYSLYVLDPLESNSAPAPVNISAHGTASSTSGSSAEQPRGVAVGLGLMSWALMSGDDRDSLSVTGTLVKQGTGQEALEVIFALRETISAKQRAWDASPPLHSQASHSGLASIQGESKRLPWYPSQSLSTMSDLTRETLASIQMRTKGKKIKAPKPVRRSNTPVTESDKLMDAVIGPLKKKGRPKGTNVQSKSVAKIQGRVVTSEPVSAQKEVIVIDGSDNENTSSSTTQSSDGTRKKRTSQQFSPPFTSAPLIRQQMVPDVQTKSEAKEPTVLDLLNLLASASPNESAPNAALLTALNAIDSSQSQGVGPAESPPNSALVAAIKQLLAICATAAPPTPSASSPLPTKPLQETETTLRHHPQSSSGSHSDGITDKENVNPVASKKRFEKDSLDKLSDPLPSVSTPNKERLVQGLRPSMRTNEVSSSDPLKEANSRSVPLARKRTLSDFMDEREAGRNKSKGKERGRADKRNLHRNPNIRRSQISPVTDAMRHYPSVLAASLPRPEQPFNYYRTPLEPWTSPAHGRPETDESSGVSSAEASGSCNSTKRTSPPNYQKVSVSSPVRAPKNGRKKYVVPEWARTDTATRPRLSEEAKRTLEEAEARKKEERKAARKKISEKQNGVKPISVEARNPTYPPLPALFALPKRSDLSQGPISACSDGPVISFPLAVPTRSSSPPPRPSPIPQTPKTPSKNRSRSTPGRENDSLFTPVIRSGSIFGSGYSQHSLNEIVPHALTSPLGNRKKAKISPTRSLFTGRGVSTPDVWTSRSSPKTSTDSVISEEHEVKSTSEKEPEETLDDLDCPPNSLPIASSDIDIDGSYSQTSCETNMDAEDETDAQPVKQHWSGLPPSSPPPPSSPMLVPESRLDDEDMDELPIATSDSETDADMHTFDIDIASPTAAGDIPVGGTNEVPMNLSEEIFTALFSMDNSSSLQQLPSSTSMDLFEQFTNLNAQSDDMTFMCDPLSTDQDIQRMFQNGLDNLDFAEFWETLKPMVTENIQPAQHDTLDQGAAELLAEDESQILPSFGEVDHAKLAGQMQALLSGCLM